MPTALQLSRIRFVQWGRDNAQLVGVGLAVVGTISYVGGKFQQLQDQRRFLEQDIKAQREVLETDIRAQREVLETDIKAQREVFEARIEAARAEAKEQKADAIQKCNEKFLTYGYAAEYRAFQQKALEKQADRV
ncbi:TPA: hypothetical protein ACH3X2_000228 [Trebouxia sp. C0005]